MLNLWKDENSDGVTDEGKLLSLKDYGIARIMLDGKDVDKHTVGGTIHRTAEAVKDTGGKVIIAEVSFETGDPVDDLAAGAQAV